MDDYTPARKHTRLAPPENWGRCSQGTVWPCWHLCSFAACRLYITPLLPEGHTQTHPGQARASVVALENETMLRKLFADLALNVTLLRIL